MYGVFCSLPVHSQTSVCKFTFSSPSRFEILKSVAISRDVSDDKYSMFRLESLSSDSEFYHLSINSKNPELEAAALAHQLSEYHPEWRVLAEYPGIVQRRIQFVKFLQSFDSSKLSALELYEAFKDSLGFVTVYRGIAITDSSDAERIRVEGIKSTSLKTDNFKIKSSMPSYFRQVLNREMMTSPADDNLISVTRYPELARALAVSFGNHANASATAVFEIQIPIIELFDAGPNGLFQMAMFSARTRFVGTLQNGIKFDQLVDEKIESFIPFRIDPKDIVGVQIFKSEPIGQTSGIRVVDL